MAAAASVVLSEVNNSSAVSHGLLEPNFTMRVKDLNTAGKAIFVESAKFELHYLNIGPESNKPYIVIGNSETTLSILTGT